MSRYLLWLLLALPMSTACGATWYVNPFTSLTEASGHTGTAVDPYMTWSEPFARARGGDTILLNPGLYTVKAYQTHSGGPVGYLTMQCNAPIPGLPGASGACVLDASRDPTPSSPTFQGNFEGGVETGQYASYLKFENLEIDNDYTGGNGLGTAFLWDTGLHVGLSAVSIHHHIILDHVTSQNGNCFALQLQDVDYATISNSVGYGSGATCSVQSGSGIEIYQAANVDLAPGPHILIYNNIVGNNKWGRSLHSDGNGIIIDDYRHGQGRMAKNVVPAYASQTLIFNNLAYHNDGRGIHIFQSGNVIAIHNTLYDNGQEQRDAAHAEMDSVKGDDNAFYNNIIVVRRGDPYLYVFKSKNVRADGNVVFGTGCRSGICGAQPGVALGEGAENVSWGPDNIMANPDLPVTGDPSPADAIAALTPRSGSPASHAGLCRWSRLASPDGTPPTDILGVLRQWQGCDLTSKGTDVGAVAVGRP